MTNMIETIAAVRCTFPVDSRLPSWAARRDLRYGLRDSTESPTIADCNSMFEPGRNQTRSSQGIKNERDWSIDQTMLNSGAIPCDTLRKAVG